VNNRTRLVVQLAMTEYMILMMGELLLYGAQLLWPRYLAWIALVGGAAVGGSCIANFIYITRLYILRHARLEEPYQNK